MLQSMGSQTVGQDLATKHQQQNFKTYGFFTFTLLGKRGFVILTDMQENQERKGITHLKLKKLMSF